MRRIAAPASIMTLALIIGLGFAGPAAAQQVTSAGVIHGQNWNMGQDFGSLNAMTRVSPLARDRAARAARQAQFNRNYSGTPIRTVSTQAR